MVRNLQNISRCCGIGFISSVKISGLQHGHSLQRKQNGERRLIGVPARPDFPGFRPENGQRAGGKRKQISPGKKSDFGA